MGSSSVDVRRRGTGGLWSDGNDKSASTTQAASRSVVALANSTLATDTSATRKRTPATARRTKTSARYPGTTPKGESTATATTAEPSAAAMAALDAKCAAAVPGSLPSLITNPATATSKPGPWAAAVTAVLAVITPLPPGLPSQPADQVRESMHDAAQMFGQAEQVSPGDSSLSTLIGNARLELGMAVGELSNLGLRHCAAALQRVQGG